MSLAVFPTLTGLAWSTFKRPTFATRVSKRKSGRTVRAADYTYPLWEFELSFDVLRADSAHLELQSLMGFFLQRQGQYDTFLFQDPTDYTVTNQQIGVGDGVTTVFPLVRNYGGWVEPIGQAVSQPTVTVGGVSSPSSAWGLVLPNHIQFNSPPAAGAAIVIVSIQFCFVCNFKDDVHEYENFMNQLWLNKSVKFISVKP